MRKSVESIKKSGIIKSGINKEREMVNRASKSSLQGFKESFTGVQETYIVIEKEEMNKKQAEEAGEKYRNTNIDGRLLVGL